MPRPCERKLGRDAGFVLKLAQTDWPVPQEDRMAPGTLSQGGRRGGRGQARPPPPGARGERPSKSTCRVCCARVCRRRRVRGHAGPA